MTDQILDMMMDELSDQAIQHFKNYCQFILLNNYPTTADACTVGPAKSKSTSPVPWK